MQSWFVCCWVYFIVVIVNSLSIQEQHNLFPIKPLFSDRIRNAEWICCFSASSHIYVNNFRLNIVEGVINCQIKCNGTEKLLSIYVSLDNTSLAGGIRIESLKLCGIAGSHLYWKNFTIIRTTSNLVLWNKNGIVLEISLVLI